MSATRAQAHDALDIARRRRSIHARLVRLAASNTAMIVAALRGDVTSLAMMLDVPDLTHADIDGLPTVRLVGAMHGVGDHRLRRLSIVSGGLDLHRRLGALSDLDRHLLAATIERGWS